MDWPGIRVADTVLGVSDAEAVAISRIHVKSAIDSIKYLLVLPSPLLFGNQLTDDLTI
jgi:hypothetical protein